MVYFMDWGEYILPAEMCSRSILFWMAFAKRTASSTPTPPSVSSSPLMRHSMAISGPMTARTESSSSLAKRQRFSKVWQPYSSVRLFISGE